jgi:hypothetical protein
VSATHVSIQAVEKEVNKGNYDCLRTLDEPHLAATLFKQWIRDLAEPLIPVEFYNRCYESVDSEEESVKLLSDFPELNRRVLRYIIRYDRVTYTLIFRIALYYLSF